MENTQKSRRRRRRGIMALMMGVAAVGSVTTATLSMAFFGSTVNAAGGFGTGSIILGVDASTNLTVTGMMPGDTVNLPLQLDNTGTGALRYVLTSTTINTDAKNLAPQITLTIKTLVGANCTVTTGATLSTGLLSANPHFGTLVSPWAGTRPLAAGANETLCFSVSLPTSVGDAYQLATANVTFLFSAQQSANNP